MKTVIKRAQIALPLTLLSLNLLAADYYIATSNLNVRTGPGTKYSISFTLQKGDKVEVLSKADYWYEVTYLGKTGYASSEYLKLTKTTTGFGTDTKALQGIVNHLLMGAYACLAVVIGFVVYERLRDRRLLQSVTNKARGTKSERDLVLKLLKHGIPKQRIFHDLYVPRQKGGFSQTDLVVLTNAGILVFEVKDYSGWIYGSGNQSRWTKVLAYGREKYYFYNPIRQNSVHIAELKRQLHKFGDIPFYSIVVFYGNCVLKNIEFVPNGTFVVNRKRVLEAVRIVMKNNPPVAFASEDEILDILKVAVKRGEDVSIRTQHVANVRDMLGKDRILE